MRLPHLRWPHHRLIARLARKFGLDPAFQLKLHLIASCVWIVNGIVATCLFLFAAGFWAKFSILYLTLISLYANFATDYGAVPGSIAAVRAGAIHEDIGHTTSHDDGVW